MKRYTKFTGNWFNKKHNKKVDVKLDLIEYSEDGIHFVYGPALDLVGYGKTDEEARKSWETVLDEYIQYTLNKNTLIADLTSRGWHINKKQLVPPTFSWMLQNLSNLSEVYNKHDFYKTSKPVSLPALETA